MKNKISTLKELWKIPKFKILIKLSGYALFFIIFFTLAAIGRNNVVNKNIPDNGLSISYNSMKTKVINNNLKVKYNIISNQEYFLEGTIINNIFTGTLENENNLKKIKIFEDQVYLIEKNIENIDETILKDINLIYIFPANIMKIINENSSIIKQIDEMKMYIYTIDNKAYTIYTKDNAINKIILLDGTITYEIELEIIS